MSVILFIIILGILVFAHELGHFLAAKGFGIRVDEFAIGFPPRIFSKKYKGTVYALNAVPIGGYVKIYGEDGDDEKENSEPKNSVGKKMSDAPRWKQGIILCSGVFGNIILAWLFLTIGFLVGLPTSSGGPFTDEIKDRQVVITAVLPNSPAEIAGIKSGDRILSVRNENNFIDKPTGEEAGTFISNLSSGSLVEISLLRQKTIVSERAEVKEGIISGKRGIGISMEDAGILKLSLPKAFVAGAYATVNMTKSVVVGIIGLLKNAFEGKGSLSALTGPVGIAIMVGDAGKLGLLNLLLLTVLISINLAVINVFPFPALDGGRLIFLAIEAVIRKPLNSKFARGANQIGFVLLLLFMAVITYKDIIKLIG